MGALFNTDGTIRLVNMLNGNYRGKHFGTLQGLNQQTMLRDKTQTTPNVAAAFGLDDDDPAVSSNWMNWLGYLDQQMQKYTDPATGVTTNQSCGMWVRLAMADALDNKPKPCSGIEFFAIPGSSLEVLLPIQQIDDAKNKNKKTTIITVQTLTIDKLGSLFKHVKRKRR
jgi:hypothetical protein